MGHKSFEAYLEAKFPASRRKAYYLMSIHDHLRQIPAPKIEALGWAKAMELAKVARSEGRGFDSSGWLRTEEDRKLGKIKCDGRREKSRRRRENPPRREVSGGTQTGCD